MGETPEHLTHAGPICALKFHNSHLLAAHGQRLKIHDYTSDESNNTLFEREILPRNKIHGIALGKEISDDVSIAFWGGRSLVLSTLTSIKDLTQEVEELSVGDWIMYAEFSHDNRLLYVLTSHNVVVIIDVQKRRLVESKECGEKSILYSGSITALDNGEILICAGTVMSGILLWELNSQKLLHNLTGHEGSIFGIRSSPDGKYLVSCSDDRSIKIWNIETGENLATGWGHGSRIWYLDFFSLPEDNQNSSFRIMSASEDCTVRLWKYVIDNDDLQCYSVFDSHIGRNIWSGAINHDLLIGVSGGADGKIKLHDLNEGARDRYALEKWELKDVLPDVDLKGESFKEYFDFGNGLVSVTAQGKVLLFKNFKIWEVLYEDENLANFSFTRGFSDSKIACLGSKNGEFTFLKFNEQCELIKKSSFKEDNFKSDTFNLLTCQSGDELILFTESFNSKDKFAIRKINIETLEVEEVHYFDKPESRFVSTCISYEPLNEWVIIGSRYVTFYLYNLITKESKLWKKHFPGDTISQIQFLPPSDVKSKELTVMFTIFDGAYAVLNFDSNLEVSSLQDNLLAKGFLEGFFTDRNGDLIIYGFRRGFFFIWNETRQFEIIKVDCGGAHRQWKLKYFYDDNGKCHFRVFFTRNGVLNMLQTGSAPFNAKGYVTAGFHGRELRSLSVSPTQTKNGERLLISGAEDTVIKLSTLNDKGELNLCWSERYHTSGIQQAKFINDRFAITTAAREELFLWKVSADTRENVHYISRHASLNVVSANKDLRIMDFDTLEVISSNGDAIGFIMMNVYSNSEIKLWYFDYIKKEFILLFEESYTTCCLLNCRLLVSNGSVGILTAATDGHIALWSITEALKDRNLVPTEDKKLKVINDNIILSKDIKYESKLLLKQQIHQSGIKDFDIKYVDQTNEVKVVTGGDDNALVLFVLTFKNQDEVDLSVSSFEPSAAASTITSVEILPCGNKVLMTSVDQVVKIWSVELDELELISEKYTTVADTGCSAVTTLNGQVYALIGGSGFDCWKV